MKDRKKSLVAGICVLVTLIICLTLTIEAREEDEKQSTDSKKRADLITIDVLESFGALERPDVPFFHDLHTDALQKNNKDCSSCHLVEDRQTGRLSLSFKRLEDTDRDGLMDLYHAECIGCHKETTSTGQTAGPIEVCGECHTNRIIASSWTPIDFDKSLHFRHTEANKDPVTGKGDCGACHHEYDEESKKLFYALGKEGSCGYCHKAETEEKRISISMASHLSCINCHKKKQSQKIQAGPVKCGGCHNPVEQKTIKTVENTPRLERKQPDLAIIRVVPIASEQEKDIGINPVPFDHKSHEKYNDSCIECHHASLDSCAKQCHTSKGSEEGNYVKIEKAMHQKDSRKSCLGCHNIMQQKQECAGCHSTMKVDGSDPSYCQKCHLKTEQDIPVPQGDEEEKIIAEKLLNSRKKITKTYADVDIPEKVTIKTLADLYEPVELEHRKIIHTLLNKIKDNNLAMYFHSDEGFICQGCHHNSPSDKKPPKCGSCHGRPFDEGDIHRPGLKGAFHQQCLGCHDVMSIDKPKATECAGCHKEKKKID